MDEVAKHLHKEIEGDFRKLMLHASHGNGHYSKDAMPTLKRALALAVNGSNNNLQAEAKIAIAFCETAYNSNYVASIELLTEAIQLFDEETLPGFLPQIHKNLGLAYHFMGNVAKAREYFINALQAYEAKNSQEPEDLLMIADVNYKLYISYNGIADEEAEKHYQKAYKLYQALQNGNGLMNCYNSRARVEFNGGNYVGALDYMQKALKICEELKDENLYYVYIGNISVIYANLNDYENWLHYSNLAYKHLSKSSVPAQMGTFYNQRANGYRQFGKFREAVSDALKAIEITSELGESLETAHNHKLLSLIYGQLSDFSNAYKHSKLFYEFLEGYMDTQRVYTEARARAMFEVEQSEKKAEMERQKRDEIEAYVRKLESSNEDLQRFAHVASHDLREPVRMITSYIGLLQRNLAGKLSPTEEEFILYINEGAHRMDGLIHDLLEYSKIGRELVLEDVDVNDVLHIVGMNLAPYLEERNAEVITTHMSTVKAEKTRMVQLFQNLINNAIKYNHSPTPRVYISCTKATGKCVFRVADNGIGIKPQFHEKVFELFQRLHLRKEFSGSGIGLTICKKIVEQLGGAIWIENPEEGGTTVCFTIPRLDK